MDASTFTVPIIAVLCFGVAQAVKKVIPKDARRYVPLGTMALGICCNVLTNWSSLAPENAVGVVGVGAISGLAAVGIYEGWQGVKGPETE